MTGRHIITRRGGISLVSNISRKRFYSFYRPGPDCRRGLEKFSAVDSPILRALLNATLQSDISDTENCLTEQA